MHSAVKQQRFTVCKRRGDKPVALHKLAGYSPVMNALPGSSKQLLLVKDISVSWLTRMYFNSQFSATPRCIFILGCPLMLSWEWPVHPDDMGV